MSNELPPCHSFNCWVGTEVEGGPNDVGQSTMFIRSLSIERPLAEYSDFALKRGIKRVWFCREFDNWDVVRWALVRFDTVCLEVSDHANVVPPDVWARCKIYFKLGNRLLKRGDYVCVGPAFCDESFEIGTGNKVTPADYAADVEVVL